MTISQRVRIGCVQTPALETFRKATEAALRLTNEAVEQGAELLCLPEYCGGLKSDKGVFKPPAATESSHPVLETFRAFSRDKKVWMLIGSIAVEGPGDRLINRGFLLDCDGEIRARYDKIHLFDIDLSETEQYRESTIVSPGDQAVVADTPWGYIGMTTCYDLRFPHLFRALAQAGAEILCVPAAFTKKTGEAHWHVLNRARAIENGAFVMAPCATGPIPGGGEVYGHSLMISPWGEVLEDAGEGEAVIVKTIDLDEVASARKRIPSLRHDRSFRPPSVLDTSARSVA